MMIRGKTELKSVTTKSRAQWTAGRTADVIVMFMADDSQGGEVVVIESGGNVLRFPLSELRAIEVE